MARACAVLILVVGLVAAAPARAPAVPAPVVVATYFQYVPGQIGGPVEIVQGTPLLLTHQDVFAAMFYLPWHDLRSVDVDEDGEHLFASPLLAFGETDFVRGVEDLGPGTYGFYCQTHSDLDMRGELVVRAV